MVDQLGSSYRDLIRSHWLWLVGSGVLLLSSTLLGAAIGNQIPGSNLTRLFSTLITAVGSLLAIGFSVLFISTQIASERYSPKFTVSFVNDPIVQLSFGWGIICIVLNLAALTISSTAYQILNIEGNQFLYAVFWGGGGFLAGMNAVFFILLYPFIRIILIQTTPENILSQFRRRYTAERYVDKAEKAEGSTSKHPMQPVYDFARNSLRREDYSAAIAAIDALFELPKDLLADLADIEKVDAEHLFKPVLQSYGISLIRQSDKLRFHEGTNAVQDGVVALGTEAVNIGDDDTLRLCFSTAYSQFYEEEASNLTNKGKESIVACCCELFSATASSPDAITNYVPRMSWLISDIDGENPLELYSVCAEEIAIAHKEVLMAGWDIQESRTENVLIGDADIRPVWDQPDDENTPPTLACTYLLMQCTGEILAQISDDDVPPGYLFEAWESFIENSNPNNQETHIQHLFRRYIEIVVFSEMNYSSGLSPAMRISGLVDGEPHTQIVQDACRSILDEERTVSELSDIRFLERELPEIWSPIPIACYSDDFLAEVQAIHDEIQ